MARFFDDDGNPMGTVGIVNDNEGVQIYTQEQIMYAAMLTIFNDVRELNKKVDILLGKSCDCGKNDK
jgi:hypothetical protein